MSEDDTGSFDRDKKGYFQPGNKIGKGRPRSSRHKLSEDFLRALKNDFKEHGITAIQDCRKVDPAAYVRVIANLLPKDININVNPIEQMDDDQLTATIRHLQQTLAGYLAPTIDATCATDAGTETTPANEPLKALPALH